MNRTAEQTVTVVLFDDFTPFREVARLWLENDGYHVVGDTGDGDELLEIVAGHRPDVALVDAGPDLGVTGERIAAIHRISPQTRAVLWSGLPEHVLRDAMPVTGADGAVTKGTPLDRVDERIRAVLADR